MFAMFGASVLVPFVFGINPAIVLFMNGVGTLIFMTVTKGQAPAYLGSSFAFLAPAGVVISAKWDMNMHWAVSLRLDSADVYYRSLFINVEQTGLMLYLPPAAMGPVVALIGLELSSSAASNAGLLDDKTGHEKCDRVSW